MVKLVIVGCGSITLWRHAPECAKSDIIELKGFYDIDAARCAEFAEKYGGKAYASYEDVLDDSDVDGVIICTANQFHCPMTVDAFKHGKHVLCEKPMAVSEEEALQMIAAAKESGKKLMIAHSQRFDAVNRALKEVVDSRKLGKILSFRTVFGHRGPETWSITPGRATWFLNKNAAGLGALGDIGIHKADLIHWLINDDIKYVTAKIATLDKKLPDGSPIAIEDNAFCILESESGIMGTLEASWTRYGKDTNITNLYCENGIVEADNNAENQITVTYRDGTSEQIKVNSADSDMAKSFAECIINDQQPELSGEEGLKALKIVLSCVESSEKNARVEI